VSTLANEAGVKLPICVTRRVWAEVIEPDEEALKRGESDTGRLWDVLVMFTYAARANRNQSEIHYLLFASKIGEAKEVYLKALVHPGDQFEPVVTILMPNED
jgi:hypothetical protein